MDTEGTQETYRFIRTMDLFFDYLNVKNPLESKLKRKDSRAPYHKCNNWSFKVRNSVFRILKGFYFLIMVIAVVKKIFFGLPECRVRVGN